MIHLCYSNRTEALLEQLACDLAAHRRRASSLFEPVRLVVPNRNVELWLKRQLARRDGIAANFEVLFLRRFLGGLVAHHDPGLRLVDGDTTRDLLLSLLLDGDRLSAADLAPVREYLYGGGDGTDAVDRRRVPLAVQLARLFEEYAFSRPDMLDAWPSRTTLPEGRWARTEVWQRALWLQLFGAGGLLDARARRTGERFLSLPQVVAQLPPDALAGGRPVFLFGASYVATLFQNVLARIAGAGTLHVYTLNPCMEFWEDVVSDRENARRERLPHRGARIDPAELVANEDPFCLKAPGDTPALVLWGRPGRENIRLLDQLSQCDFHAAFADPLDDRSPTLLAQVQHDILVREPARERPSPTFAFAGDESIGFLACPGVRREAEAIASEIWALLERDPELRLSDIAVMVAGRDPESYFTHLASAFDERGFELPFTLEATVLGAHSRVAEAAELLLELPFGRFTRSEVLRVLTHPVVAGRVRGVDPQQWVRGCDALGIFHGADRQDQAGTYLDEDLHNWDQGLRRLALGAVMTGRESDDARAFELGGQAYLPEEHTEIDEGAAAFGLLARSLLADCRFVRSQSLPMADWAEILGRMLEVYLVPQGEGDRVDLDTCIASVRALAEVDLDGRRVSYRVARDLAAAATTGLRKTVSGQADEGVILSTLEPMRALPFKVIFIAGLGEGRFPAANRSSELDLRGARMRAGDVSAREQDQYMFLETLLCARERLYLSYVARNELTGDPLEPSPVVVELQRMLARGYLPGAVQSLTRWIPLRRFDSVPSCSEPPTPPEARAEAQMYALKRAVQPVVGTRPIDLATLRGLFSKDVASDIEGRLRLCRAPRTGRDLNADGPLRIRLADLRRFLECPIQGTARFFLRLEDDVEDRALVEDEPFEAGRREQVSGQRAIFLDWLRSGRTAAFEDLARAWAGPLIAAGRLPASYLWELDKGSLLEGPRVWKELIEQLGHGPAAVRVHRFGPASEHARVDVKHDPIRITVELDGAVAPVHAEIVGTTGALLDDGASEIGLFERTSNGSGWLEEARRRHDSLAAFIDHVALCASGVRESGFTALQLYDYRGAGEAHPIRFAPIDRSRALSHLAGLVREMLQVEEVLFPAAAAFAWLSGKKDSFAETLDEVRERGYFASAYGPVRNAPSFSVPTDAQARELTARRLGLYLQSVADEPSTAGDETVKQRGAS